MEPTCADSPTTRGTTSTLPGRPHGPYIVFSSDRDGNYDIYVMETDGTYLYRLTDHPSADRGAAWAPDGRHIAFHSDRDDGDWDLYVMEVDGTNPRRLTHHRGMDMFPAWSPDGGRIAFSSDRDGDNSRIYVMEFLEWTRPCCRDHAMPATFSDGAK